jgi:hypothetical protein
MYTSHSVFIDPQKPFELLWRYMDWPRFLTLLKTRKLYFVSAKFLQSIDPFEGSLPKPEYTYWISTISKDALHDGVNAFREQTYVNCWHYNNTESVAMWKLYAPTGNGIAIQTTISEFKKSFDAFTLPVYAGKVIYIDYEIDRFYKNEELHNSISNGLVSFIHKRKMYAHEQEYRAVIHRYFGTSQQPRGLLVDVDLHALVKRVIVAPQTPIWIKEAVQLVLDELDFEINVENSIGDINPDV